MRHYIKNDSNIFEQLFWSLDPLVVRLFSLIVFGILIFIMSLIS